MQREPYNDQITETQPQKWFWKTEKGEITGTLAEYLMDPDDIFTSQLAKNITKLANNLSYDHELAQKRFDEVSKNVIYYYETKSYQFL